jgi:hypothetical protein
MKEELLKELLERYYNGTSSQGEEQLLKDYFSSDDVLPDYEPEKEMFRMFRSMPVASPEPDFEARILEAVGKVDEKGFIPGTRIRLLTFTGIAAGLLILIASYFMLKQKSEPADTYSDPRIAYVETMKVLRQVSVKLNRGTSPLKNMDIIERNARSAVMSIDRTGAVIRGSLAPIGMVKRLDNDINK